MKKIRVSSFSRSQMLDITDKVQQALEGSTANACVVFIPHTTAGITINENADPSVKHDILEKLDRMVPWDEDYTHGEGNSAAHIKASLMGFSVTVLLEEGKLKLGTWQGICLTEFDGPRKREVFVQEL